MKKNRIFLSSIAALTILSSQALAEQAELGSVDVWETEIISSSLNLGKDAIETKQADHLSDLLRDLPGVSVGGTHSVNNRVSIRSLQDENLDITLDGAKVQNVNMFHHIGNLLINPDILKKADIQVGTNSVVNGSLGGSIAFETKDGKDMLRDGENFGARISSTYNSNKSISGSLTGYGKVSEDLSFLIYTNYVDRGNWKYGSGERTFGFEGENKNILLKGTYDISDSQSISFSYDKLTDEGDYVPRPNFSAAANEAFTGAGVTFPTEYSRDTITVKHKLENELVNMDTTVYSNTNDLTRYETWVGRTPRPTFAGELEGDVKTVGINLKAQSNIETGNILHTLTYGALYDKQTSEVTWEGAAYGEDEEAKTVAVYVENAIDFDNGLVLTPGVRFTSYDLDGASAQIDDNEFTYSLAAEYAVTDSLSLLASATTLYKGVEMVDVLASNRTNGDPSKSNNIKSETGINKEAGFRYIDGNFGFSFKYFNTTIEDYIENEWSAGYVDNYMVNAGDLDIKGFEASLKYVYNDLSTLLTFSSTESEFDDTGLSTDYEVGDTITLNLDYKISPTVNLSWNSIFVEAEKDNGETDKPGYSVHNFAVNAKPTKNLTVIAGIDNIFDKEYTDHASVSGVARGVVLADDEPRRNFKVTLSYRF